MQIKSKIITITAFLFFCFSNLYAQNDSIPSGKPVNSIEEISTEKKKEPAKYKPRKAIIRSAMIPGWGQVTNKKIWKVPVVYAAIGITTYFFTRNLKQYKDSKDAYILAIDGNPSNDYLIKEPYFSVKDQPERIRNFRNEVRQNIDYSALFFLLFWGLNVVDAAVDAHLKTFDVNDNLSLQLKPGYSPLAQTNGISIVLNFHK